ncbi:MAG: RNA polymerase sigma factor SigJ [Acidimicrobiales bacterium]
MGDVETFVELRPWLFGVAYRMLGVAAEAEDVLQDAYLRWASVDDSSVESPRAYLTTIVTRLSIDQLRAAKVGRGSYKGPWLPEPIEAGSGGAGSGEVGSGGLGSGGLGSGAGVEPGPEAGVVLADSLSLAFLVLLEELAPAERAAFLLREVFGYEYSEIARMLERNEPACRQLVSRARHRVGDRRKRFEADHEQSRELTRRFVFACGTGDIEGLMSLLAEDVVVWTDGGGKATSAPRPVVGPWRAARFLVHVAKTFPNATVGEMTLNGQPGLIFEENGRVTSAVVIDVLDGKIAGIRVVANPEKLTALQRRFKDEWVSGLRELTNRGRTDPGSP